MGDTVESPLVKKYMGIGKSTVIYKEKRRLLIELQREILRFFNDGWQIAEKLEMTPEATRDFYRINVIERLKTQFEKNEESNPHKEKLLFHDYHAD